MAESLSLVLKYEKDSFTKKVVVEECVCVCECVCDVRAAMLYVQYTYTNTHRSPNSTPLDDEAVCREFHLQAVSEAMRWAWQMMRLQIFRVYRLNCLLQVFS